MVLMRNKKNYIKYSLPRALNLTLQQLETRLLLCFQIMFMYSLDRVLEKSTLSVDILSVDRGKLDALVFPSNAGAEEGFNCRLSCMKCCGRCRLYSSSNTYRSPGSSVG